MKQLRELFARNSSRWLAIELILVTCACMWAFDPVLVNAYVTHQPMGYDPDQLVSMEVGSTMTTAVISHCVRETRADRASARASSCLS